MLMATPTLDTIEAAIEQLSLSEQLTLMERLASRIRSRTLRAPIARDSDLAAMANDPAIRGEIRQIEAEFAATEADGLDNV
jgi:hypothetical protein